MTAAIIAPHAAQQVDTVTVEARLHAKTETRIRVSNDGDDRKAIWISLKTKKGSTLASFVDTGRRERQRFGALSGCEVINLTIPRWLAKKEGLA